MKTILVPLDGSALAEGVLPYARSLAVLLSANICLLKVIPEFDPYNLLGIDSQLPNTYTSRSDVQPPYEPTSWELLRRDAIEYLAAKAARLRNADVKVEIQVRLGTPALAIIEAAHECQAALIMMATHAYHGLQRWVLGSVGHNVVHNTTIPVFLVRSSSKPTLIAPPLRHIMVPLDGSELARHALPVAVDLATHALSELLLLRAADPAYRYAPQQTSAMLGHNDMLGALQDRLMEEVGTFTDELDQQKVVVTPVTRYGLPAATIIDEVERRGVDLLVMATHGYNGLKRWALGSVADTVLHATRTPLLLVRA